MLSQLSSAPGGRCIVQARCSIPMASTDTCWPADCVHSQLAGLFCLGSLGSPNRRPPRSRVMAHEEKSGRVLNKPLRGSLSRSLSELASACSRCEKYLQGRPRKGHRRFSSRARRRAFETRSRCRRASLIGHGVRRMSCGSWAQFMGIGSKALPKAFVNLFPFVLICDVTDNAAGELLPSSLVVASIALTIFWLNWTAFRAVKALNEGQYRP